LCLLDLEYINLMAAQNSSDNLQHDALSLPVFALVGRPNVGKSTLFNQLTRSRDALVANFAGLTRDRQYGMGRLGTRAYQVIDTGGIAKGDTLPLGVKLSQDPDRALINSLQQSVEEQAKMAMKESAVVLLVVDARDGFTPQDDELLQLVRKSGRPFMLVVNKVDGLNEANVMAEFSELGIVPMVFVSAAHGKGVHGLLDEAFELMPEALVVQGELGSEQLKSDMGIRVALIGRPNVGKSTLTNRFLGDDRVVVSDMPGTTRDSVFIPFEHQGQQYTLIDTAGVRRRGKVSETVEKFSVLKTFAAINVSDVVLMLIDAEEPFVEQDLHLISAALEANRPVIIVVNKWDGLSEDSKAYVRSQIQRRLNFLDGVSVSFVSALYGSGVGHLYGAIRKCYTSFCAKPKTAKLNQILSQALSDHPPPMVVKGRRIKLKYVHLGGTHPPRLVFFGNQCDKLPDSYKRYLSNYFRKALNLMDIPLPLSFKSPENPYSGKKNKLTPRQVRRRKRMMKHVKKKK